jgi:selenocysteine lyase/cysteine desulfurase
MTGRDAVFLSPHKFVGGSGAPGVLVATRSLLRNRVPSVRQAERSCSSALKDGVGIDEIRRREQDFARRALALSTTVA